MTASTELKPPQIPFIDLAAQRSRIGAAIDAAILKVAEHGAYIMGPEVVALERDLTAFCGAKHAITCANGTDALALPLMAKGVGPGDAVLCPSFTFAATAEVIAWVGATPVFVDVDGDTFNMDGESLKRAIMTAKAAGLKPRAVIAVDLFGQPADYDVIEPIAAESGMWLMDDAAQGFGATYRGRSVGTIGHVTATSFFPAKPLGCYGDGGAVFTDDTELAAVLRSLRVHGQGSDKYDNVRIGMNGRLDTMQAAVLIEKLKIFSDEIAARNRVADRYTAALSGQSVTPKIIEGARSVWAQYTLRVPAAARSEMMARLKQQGIPTAIYYPKPLHKQTAYMAYPVAEGGLPVSERIATEVVSLPMHPYLDPATQDYIITALQKLLP